jgi:WXG100 family type VII secretion target
MAEQTILNYDELQRIAKSLDTESEELVDLLSKTRQKVHELHDDWIGKGADKFFDEMESEVLPGMGRLNQALAFTSETLRAIMKIFDTAENETANFFSDGQMESSGGGSLGDTGTQSGIDVGNLDFGLNGPGQTGGTPPGIKVGDLDFGLDNTGQTDGTAPGIKVGDLEFGLGDSGQPGAGGAANAAAGDGNVKPSAADGSQADAAQADAAQNAQSAAGGGGGGGSSSSGQGIQGGLNMGVGSSNQTIGGAHGVDVGGGRPSAEPLPDHVYQGNAGGSGGTPPAVSGAHTPAATPPANPQHAAASGGGSGQSAESSDIGSLAGAAGALGGVGAAAGAAAKVVKGKKDNT